jgi:hypothetical protein
MEKRQKIVVTLKQGEIRMEFSESQEPQKPKRPWYHKYVWYLSWLITGGMIANAIDVLQLV